jgi:phosphonate dehydrogenase
VHQEVIDYLSRYCEVITNQGLEPFSRDELVGRAKDVSALIVFMTDQVDDPLLSQCPKLQIVACALKGYDNIDVAACTKYGIWVTIVEDLLTAPTAEIAVGLMIAAARHIVAGDKFVRSGVFAGWRPKHYGVSLDGSIVGLIGAGAVGKAIARRLRGFKCQLIYHDKKRLSPEEEDSLRLQRAPLTEVVQRSDLLVLALPLNAESQHLIDEDLLKTVKPGCFLINPARGSLVDEEAVADALEDGRLGGYAADAFEMEDWARVDRPAAISSRLMDSEKTVLTPHIGSAVDTIRRDIAMDAARNVVQCLESKTPESAINKPDPVDRSSL